MNSVRGVNYASSPLLAAKTPAWRSSFIVVLVALGFCGLAARAAYVQVFGNDFFLRQGEVRFARTLELPAFIERLSHCRNVVQPFHLMTHFSQSDEQDTQATRLQIEEFNRLSAHLPGERAMANSAGILAWPASRSDWIRPGLMLYGASPFTGQLAADHDLRPVMNLKSQLIATRACQQGEAVGYGGHWVADRNTTLGVVAAGYGDGYPRMAPEGTPMLINGRRVPIVGRVSMDMITVDLGPAASDKVGDEVTLWGEGLPVEQVAEKIGTIPYELLTRLTSRVHLIPIRLKM